jgi:excisionase family DNA binding protein
MQTDPYLTARDVADLLKLNVETVYILIAKERLPAVKIGGQWRFDASEIHNWFKTRPSASNARSRRSAAKVGGAVQDGQSCPRRSRER